MTDSPPVSIADARWSLLVDLLATPRATAREVADRLRRMPATVRSRNWLDRPEERAELAEARAEAARQRAERKAAAAARAGAPKIDEPRAGNSCELSGVAVDPPAKGRGGTSKKVSADRGTPVRPSRSQKPGFTFLE